MKKSRNFIISSLVALAGVTLASSVTGTVAWFQYATSASVAYTGTTVACSKLLQLSVDGGAPATDVVIDNDDEFYPVTSGAMAKDDDLGDLYLGPTYRKADMSDWDVATAGTHYQQFTLAISFNDVSDGDLANGTPETANIKLTDMTIANAGNGDIKKAVRVHLAVDGGNSYLFSATGGSIDVCGQLDLNNDGELDTSGYAFQNQAAIDYNGTGEEQESYAASAAAAGIALGSTGGASLEITVTIWVEGWAKLAVGHANNYEDSDTAVWDNETYNAKDFHVGMTFDVA